MTPPFTLQLEPEPWDHPWPSPPHIQSDSLDCPTFKRNEKSFTSLHIPLPLPWSPTFSRLAYYIATSTLCLLPLLPFHHLLIAEQPGWALYNITQTMALLCLQFSRSCLSQGYTQTPCQDHKVPVLGPSLSLTPSPFCPLQNAGLLALPRSCQDPCCSRNLVPAVSLPAAPVLQLLTCWTPLYYSGLRVPSPGPSIINSELTSSPLSIPISCFTLPLDLSLPKITLSIHLFIA